MPTVTTPTLTAIETAPASAEAAWDLSRLLASDLKGTWQVTTTWPGQLGTGNTSAEKRIVSTNRPRRTIRFDQTSDHNGADGAADSVAARMIHNGLLRMGQCRSLVPLYPDYTTLTAASSGATLTCDTTLRRLFVGGLVAIGVATAGSVRYARFETGVIASLTSSSVTLAASPSSPYPASSRLFPLLLCDVQVSTSARRGRGGQSSLTIEAFEVTGPTAIPALSDPGDMTSLWTSTVNGYPVFFPGLSSGGRVFALGTSSAGWRRDSRVAQVGSGSVYELLGTRPRETSSRTAQAVVRANAWPLLQFFDACRGRTHPFILPSTFNLGRPPSITSTTVTLPAAGPVYDWQAYPYLTVIGPEPSPAAARVLPISSVSRSGGLDTITLGGSLDSAVVANPIAVRTARLVRFDSADLTETWKTSTNLSIAFDTVEVLSEATVAISNL